MRLINYIKHKIMAFVDIFKDENDIDEKNVVGFISPLTDNFCSSCNRIRVTSNGMLYPCLGDNGSVNLKKALHKNDSEIIKIIRNSIYHKPEKHFFNIKEKAYVQDRFMNTTGG